MKNVKVIRATQSPLNKKQWHVCLECGHEGWVTASRRPSRVPQCNQPHDTPGPGMRVDGEEKRIK